MLNSANQNQSGIPQQILDEKAEELRKRKETQDAINVSSARLRSTNATLPASFLSVAFFKVIP